MTFDIDFLKAMYVRCNSQFRHSWSIVDLKHFMRTLIELRLCGAENSRQDTMIKYFGIRKKGRKHTALVDCEHLLAICHKFRRLLPAI